MRLKEKIAKWWLSKKKEWFLKREDRKRGGKARRDRKRKERREEILGAKWAMYSDLQDGWMLGDFRPSHEHVKELTGWRGITIKRMEEIYLHYRAWQNQEIRHPY